MNVEASAAHDKTCSNCNKYSITKSKNMFRSLSRATGGKYCLSANVHVCLNKAIRNINVKVTHFWMIKSITLTHRWRLKCYVSMSEKGLTVNTEKRRGMVIYVISVDFSSLDSGALYWSYWLGRRQTVPTLPTQWPWMVPASLSLINPSLQTETFTVSAAVSPCHLTSSSEGHTSERQHDIRLFDLRHISQPGHSRNLSLWLPNTQWLSQKTKILCSLILTEINNQTFKVFLYFININVQQVEILCL